jgi:bacterioferritin-associated ferredoxin
MFVCICHAVSDAEVNAAIDDGAGTVAAVTAACKAGGDCGSCHEQIGKMIHDAAQRECSGPQLVALRTRAA